VPVIFVNGHPYVGLEGLAHALNGSVSSSGAKVALNLPTQFRSSRSNLQQQRQPPRDPAPAPTQAAPSNPGIFPGIFERRD